MLEHGGRLQFYAQTYQRPVKDWLDLSTGINPNGWTIPTLPASVWSRLPEDEDGLISAAQAYYQTNSLLALSGSQAAIQILPTLRATSRIGIISPAYAEHQHCWQQAGHRVQAVRREQISQQLPDLDVLIIVHPNNPSGERFSPEQLLDWQQQLAKRQGWLIIDEAFIDTNPEQSLAPLSPLPGLIILRSVGKFFGLAGLRVGFALAENKLLSVLAEKLGPWPIAHASRYLATLALQDKPWQQQTRLELQQASQRLNLLLTNFGLPPNGNTDLFQWVITGQAANIHHKLAQQGILTRLFEAPASLRFGLPGSEAEWQRLQQALEALSP